MNEYFNITDFLQAFGRLEGKVDHLLRLEQARAKREDAMERRVRSLENWRAWMIGALALLGTLYTALLKLL